MEIIAKSGSGICRRIHKPVFVTGCSNSGTTILWQALLEHPDFSGPSIEGQDLTDLPRQMRHSLGRMSFRKYAHPEFRGVYHMTERDFCPSMAERVASIYGEHLTPGTRLIEKSPSNAMRLRLLQSIFPDATFILIVRNGFAVGEGIRRKRWYDPARQHMAGLQTTIRDAALQWHHANLRILHDLRYLRRWIVVKYEDLVSSPMETVEQIRQLCDCQDAPCQELKFETDLNEQQISRLSAAEILDIENVAHSLLHLYGYTSKGESYHAAASNHPGAVMSHGETPVHGPVNPQRIPMKECRVDKARDVGVLIASSLCRAGGRTAHVEYHKEAFTI